MLLRLKASATNLIDKGIEYNDFQGDAISDYVMFNGAAPDLGCYETTSGGEAPTGLNNCLETAGKSAPVFDLQGRRVDASYHGVVVSKGRKYVQ